MKRGPHHLDISQEVDVDLTFVHDRLKVTQLHLAALQGNTRRIKLLIKNNSCHPDCSDNEDETPLFYALRANKVDAFFELIRQGADPYVMNKAGLDVRCLALYLKFNNMIDKDFYKLIKSAYGISKESKIKIVENLKVIMKEAHENASKLGKKLLILIGEIHDSFPIYQIEKIIFNIAKGFDIDVGYAERPDFINFYNPLRKKMKEKFGFTFYPVDTGRTDNSSFSERDFRHRERCMSKEIKNKDMPGIFVTGCVHLHGFYNIFKNSKQYHILPINLSRFESLEFEHDKYNYKYRLAMDNSCVFQADENGVDGTLYRNYQKMV
jgi:hypothetical protein